LESGADPDVPEQRDLKEIMSEPKRAQGNAPWVVAGGLILLVAVITIALVHTISVRHDNDKNVGERASATQSQQEAVQVAATEAANLITYTRKAFSADFSRALNGATGGLKSDLVKQKANTLSAMTKGKFDLKASVVESAFESESGGKVLVLVTLNGKHVLDSGAADTAAPQRLELTMVKSGGKWLASNLSSVGIQ
jgi:hypothetical protein